ncbi:MAG: SDR family NAD(P)-dependent oxidoreductase, partial [Bacteroidetes bacterium]
MRFSGKRVLITGGSRGIGRATAIAFAKEGARVAINFVANKEAALKTIQAMPGAGHIAIKGNIASASVARRVMDTAVRELGGLDILVNNAGIYELHPVQ